MNGFTNLVLHPRTVGAILIAATGYLAYMPTPSTADLQDVSKQYQFQATEIDKQGFENSKVHQDLFTDRIAPFAPYMRAFLPIGAAMTDLNGDGKPNEACLTNPRRKTVRVVALDSAHFQPFQLNVPNHRDAIPTGCLPGDFNEDGLTDLMVYFWGRTPVIFQSRAGATPRAIDFTPLEVVEPIENWFTHSIATADIDGDGRLDLAVAGYYHHEANVLNRDGETGDTMMNKGFGNAENGGLNRLLLGQKPDGNLARFQEVKDIFAGELGGTQWTLGVGIADLDNDAKPEVWFVNDHGADRLLHNRSQPGKPEFKLVKNKRNFLRPKSFILGQDDFHGMGIDFADMNQDGHLDAFISNFGADYTFHQSHHYWQHTGQNDLFKSGQAPYEDVAESQGTSRTRGIPWDIRAADFNNDGKQEYVLAIGFMRGTINRVPELQEVALSNDVSMQFPEAWHNMTDEDDIAGQYSNSFFAANAEGHYIDIGDVLDFKEKTLSRGIATGDVNGDGRLDLLVANQDSPTRFHKNTASSSQGFLGVNLNLTYEPSDANKVVVRTGQQPSWSGPRSRAAVGATVTIELANGKRAIAAIDGGSGVGGKKHSFAHFGLGDYAGQKVKTTISWRDTQGVQHNQTVELNQGWNTLWLGATPQFAGVK